MDLPHDHVRLYASRGGTPLGPKTMYLTTATLAVVPDNLQQQWANEILKHCKSKRIGHAYRYYGEGKKGVAQNDVDFFRRYTIVLATYHEVMSSWPDEEAPRDLSKEEQRQWHLNTLAYLKHHIECSSSAE